MSPFRRFYLVVLAGLIAFVLLALGSCSTATSLVRVTHTQLESAGGTVTCDQNNFPIIILDDDEWYGPNRWYALTHERRHVTDMLEYPGGCEAFYKRFGEDLIFRVEAEVRAYCDGMWMAMARNSHQHIHHAETEIGSYLSEVPEGASINVPCRGRTK